MLINGSILAFLGFFVFCFPSPFRKLPISNQRKIKWFVLITILGILYGTAMEFVQDNWIPNRSFELLDIAADSTGCLLALFYSFRKFLREGL